MRLGSSVPKAFVKIGTRTMLFYSLVTVRQVSSIDELVITVPAGFENAARAEVAAAGLSSRSRLHRVDSSVRTQSESHWN